MQDGAKVDEGATQRVRQEPLGTGDEAAQAQVTEGACEADPTMRIEHDEETGQTIISAVDEIAEAAKTAESTERPCAKMDELRCQGEEQRVGFELQMAEARNVKAAMALLADYEGDVEILNAGEPWLLGAGASASEQTGTTGLPNTGAATDEGAQMRRWRKIAGIEDEKGR